MEVTGLVGLVEVREEGGPGGERKREMDREEGREGEEVGMMAVVTLHTTVGGTWRKVLRSSSCVSERAICWPGAVRNKTEPGARAGAAGVEAGRTGAGAGAGAGLRAGEAGAGAEIGTMEG